MFERKPMEPGRFRAVCALIAGGLYGGPGVGCGYAVRVLGAAVAIRVYCGDYRHSGICLVLQYIKTKGRGSVPLALLF